MVQCCANGCSADGTHFFPKDEDRRKRWEIALKRNGFKSTRHSRLCKAHFKPEDYITTSYYTGISSKRKILNKTAVPSVFRITRQLLPSNSTRKACTKRRATKPLNSSVKRRKTVAHVPDPYAEVEAGLGMIIQEELDIVENVKAPDATDQALGDVHNTYAEVEADLGMIIKKEPDTAENGEAPYSTEQALEDIPSTCAKVEVGSRMIIKKELDVVNIVEAPNATQQALEDVPNTCGKVEVGLRTIIKEELDIVENGEAPDATEQALEDVPNMCAKVEVGLGMIIKEELDVGENVEAPDATEQAFVDVPDTCAEVEGGLGMICKKEPADTVKNVASKVTCTVGTQKSCQFFSIENFRKNDEAICFYTGLETYDKFKLVFWTLCPEAYSIKYRYSQVLNLSVEDQLFLTLIKLKQNKEDFELSLLFGISRTTVSNIFYTWINFMHRMWSMLNVWPNREIINSYMIDGFKKLYPSTKVIVDCTKVPVEKSNNPATQQACFSNENSRTTFEVEVAATPRELLSHGSKAHEAGGSDCQIVEKTSILDKCEKGDSIRADRRFNVQDRKLSSKQGHIKKIIGLTKTYKFLQVPLKRCHPGIVRKIYGCCHMICNFREGIVYSST